MEVVRYPNKNSWTELLKRPSFDTRSLDVRINEVLSDVKSEGDTAVIKYTARFDKVKLESFQVSEEEIRKAPDLLSAELKESINLAIYNITRFHEAQKPTEVKVTTQSGVECWQKPVPIEKVGLYVPGGTAPLFSTVLMLAIPARLAGCSETILCSPPDRNGCLHPAILYSAKQVGVTRIFKIGGVQAIGAMAYGTETVPKVYKIFGPGNQYVTAAKQLVSREAVAIDMPAGPSEVAVIADSSSNPAFVASDLLSQAEHGPDSQVILFSTDENIVGKVQTEINRMLSFLSRADLANKSLKHSKCFILESSDELIEMVNTYAPEHLIISTKNADNLASDITNAGSVFVGPYTPESAGDYASGTNHTLPTNGWATAYSGVNMDSYYKKITFQKISAEGLQKIGPAIEQMAEAEELTAHKEAVNIRLKELNKQKNV